jgi:hypothetical protein
MCEKIKINLLIKRDGDIVRVDGIQSNASEVAAQNWHASGDLSRVEAGIKVKNKTIAMLAESVVNHILDEGKHDIT